MIIKNRRRILLLLFLLLFFGILFGKKCLFVLVSTSIGYSETGHANTTESLPECLSDLSLFTTQWPIHYHYSTNVHSNMGYCACGHSTFERVNSACQKLKMELQPWKERNGENEFYSLDQINGQFREWLDNIPPEERKLFEGCECTEEDYIFSGIDSKGGVIDIGYFRRSDGFFAILGSTHAFPSSEVKGIRTVYVPGIGRLQN